MSVIYWGYTNVWLLFVFLITHTQCDRIEASFLIDRSLYFPDIFWVLLNFILYSCFCVKIKFIFRYYFYCFSADNFPCYFCWCCCMCSSHLLTFCLFYCCCSCCWEWLSLFYGQWQWLDVKIRNMALGQQQKLVLFARGLYMRTNKSTNGRIWRFGFVNRSNGRTVYYICRVLFFLVFLGTACF